MVIILGRETVVVETSQEPGGKGPKSIRTTAKEKVLWFWVV
jgi:hypothetical protein